MRFKSTYLMALLFLAMGAYVYVYEIKGGRERQEAEESEKKVFLFEKDDVDWIYLDNYDNTFRFERGPVGWEIKEPIETKGDDNQIDLILTSLENAEIERIVIDSTQDMSPFGLDDPQVALQIGVDNDVFDTLYLGHHNPTQSFVYSRLSGENKVFLLPATLYNNTNKKLFTLRDKSVLKFDRDEVKRISLSRRDDTVVLEREEEKWRIKSPIDYRADRSKVDRVINVLSNLRVKEFASEEGKDLAEYGLDDPWGRVDLYLGENLEMKSLILGKAKESGDVFVKDLSREPVFLVPSAIVTQVNEKLENFRDKKILEFERSEVSEIRLTYPEQTVICEKDTLGEWYLYAGQEPIRYPAKEGTIRQLLSDLYNLRVEEFVGVGDTSLEPYGLNHPKVVVRLSGEDSALATLTVGKEGMEEVEGVEKEYLYVMNDRDGWICTVSGDILDKIVLDEDDLKEEEKEDLAVGSTE